MYYDVCIVGAGIAGASLASVLARTNRSVALVDRSWKKEESIVGELLQPSGVMLLQELGFKKELEAVCSDAIKGYALCLDKEWLQMPYPSDGQYEGLGFRYCDIVDELRKVCQAEKHVDCLEGNVTGVFGDNRVDGIKVQSGKESTQIHSKITVVCQGSLKSLGKTFQLGKKKMTGFMVGLLLKNCELPFAQHGHVVMGNQAPILFYPVGNNEVRVLVDFSFEQAFLKGERMSAYLLETVLPELPETMHESFRKAVKEGGFITKPTMQLAARPQLKPGMILLGDTLNARHPITGGGMTVALSDVKSLSKQLEKLSLFDDEANAQAINRFYKDHHNQNATINILALGLYRVFKHKTLRRACFDYLRTKSQQPMALLAGISRNRWNLYQNFIAVAMKPIPQLLAKGRFKEASITLYDASMILMPLIRDEIPDITKTERQKKSKSERYELATKRKQEPQGAGT